MASVSASTLTDTSDTSYTIKFKKKEYTRTTLVELVDERCQNFVQYLPNIAQHISEKAVQDELNAFIDWNTRQGSVCVKTQAIEAHLLMLLQWPVIWHRPLVDIYNSIEGVTRIGCIHYNNSEIKHMDDPTIKGKKWLSFHASSCIRRMGFNRLHESMAEMLRPHNASEAFIKGIEHIMPLSSAGNDDKSTPSSIRIVATSDTHQYLERYSNTLTRTGIPTTERPTLLVHAGDLCFEGSRSYHNKHTELIGTPLDTELGHLNTIKTKLNANYAVFCGGNHDFLLEKFNHAQVSEYLTRKGLENVVYLHEDLPPVQLVLGNRVLRVWGTSFSMAKDERDDDLGNYAFQCNPSKTAEWLAHIRSNFARWSRSGCAIVDLLVMHGPPLKCDELTKGSAEVGERELALLEVVRPSLVICGHSHRPDGRYVGETFEPFTTVFNGHTKIVNAAAMGVWNEPVWNPFIEIEVESTALNVCATCKTEIAEYDLVTGGDDRINHLYCVWPTATTTPPVIGQVVGGRMLDKKYFDNIQVGTYEGIAAFYAPNDRSSNKGRAISHDVILGYDFLGNFYNCELEIQVLSVNSTMKNGELWDIHSCAFWLLEGFRNHADWISDRKSTKVPTMPTLPEYAMGAWSDAVFSDAKLLIEIQGKLSRTSSLVTPPLTDFTEWYNAFGKGIRETLKRGTYKSEKLSDSVLVREIRAAYVQRANHGAQSTSLKFGTTEAAYHAGRFWPIASRWVKGSVNDVYKERDVFKKIYGECAFPCGEDDIKAHMRAILRKKFAKGTTLKETLKATRNKYIIEVNAPDNSDTRWANRCVGDPKKLQDSGNWLGRLLMEIRDDHKYDDTAAKTLVMEASKLTSQLRLDFSFVPPGKETDAISIQGYKLHRKCELANIDYPPLNTIEDTSSVSTVSGSSSPTSSGYPVFQPPTYVGYGTEPAFLQRSTASESPSSQPPQRFLPAPRIVGFVPKR
jgi:predicted phosphodiesterase